MTERWRNLPKKVLDQFTKNFEKYDIDASGTVSLKSLCMSLTLGNRYNRQNGVQIVAERHFHDQTL